MSGPEEAGGISTFVCIFLITSGAEADGCGCRYAGVGAANAGAVFVVVTVAGCTGCVAAGTKTWLTTGSHHGVVAVCSVAGVFGDPGSV